MKRQFFALLLGLVTGLAYAECPPLQGSLEQGGLVWGEVAPGSRVSLDGEVLDVLPDGTFIAGFGRDAGDRAELVVEGVAPCRQTLQIAAR